ncbi:MAG: heme oxygenase (biliverdin-producing) [Tepidiformaceae bacterium]
MSVSEAIEVPSFSASIRAATWGAHGTAESAPFMRDLLAGTASREQYAAFTAQQYFVYRALENAAELMRNDPLAGPFVRDELTRLPELAADLEFFLGPTWQATIVERDAARAYRQRIEDVCFNWSGGFVAHHYVRYMGDLSGGQFIGRAVQGAYGATADRGARFFAFPEIADRDAFKNGYRARLDAWPDDAVDRQRMIDEILVAYQLNTELAAQIR